MSEPKSTLLSLQEHASVIKVVIVCGICTLNAASHGMTAGYSTEGAIIYSTPNATSLIEPLNETQISWFSKFKLKETN